MNRLEQTFTKVREESNSALVGFITAGDPDTGKSLKIIRAMLDSGVDILELGIAFSDPTADGAAIQRSSQRALAAGITLQQSLELVRELRRDYSQPIIIFSYYNPILAYGLEKFSRDTLAAGADGVLIVDLPPEERGEIEGKFSKDLARIRLIAPTTPLSRVGYILEDASGFAYVISKTGITGTGEINTNAVEQHIAELRQVCDLPLCVGFGISTPEQTAAVAGYAEGVVIGSAFERIIEDNLNNPELITIMKERVSSIKEAMSKTKK